jgi:uroporphyrin-III C-methyltransferase
MKPATPPKVTLVGAGPGDPELLTLKAVKALRQATVVLVDDLVHPGVLKYLRRGARVLQVGKRGGRPCAAPPAPAAPAAREGAPGPGRIGARPRTPQAFIHKLMVAEARRGERVLRLKGGDPFVFGRGGEECDALRAAGIEVEVISGLTSGLAGPAGIGVPVTDRRHASGVALVTGHACEGGHGPDWAVLARSGLTLVVYMGVARVRPIVEALRAGGMDAATPAAVVSRAHTVHQRHSLCVLGTLADTMASSGLGSPAILVIGDVVRAAPWWQAADRCDAVPASAHAAARRRGAR